MTAQPWQPAKYPRPLYVNRDGTPAPAPRARRRTSLLAALRRPSRTAQLERLLDRYRWANTGLRERLRVEVTAHDVTLDSVQAHADEWARTLGHAHPLVVGLRAIVGKGRVR